MEIVTFLIDFILHVDKYLEAFVQSYGMWVYALLFLIVFVETGVVVMPFLPGDSLLFVVGALCGVGLMSYPLAVGLLLAAAILGNQSNYTIGRFLGPKVFQWEDSRFFNKAALKKTHAFYEKHGGKAIIIARFMPLVRTFVPVVAGVANMGYRQFATYNVIGGAAWVLAGIRPLAAALFAVAAVWLAVCARDLADHAERVRRPLVAGDLAAADRLLQRPMRQPGAAACARQRVQAIEPHTRSITTCPRPSSTSAP